MKTFIIRFRAFCVSCFPFVAFAMIISNFIVSCSVYKSAHPRYFYNTVVVTNEVLSVVSNFSPSVSSVFPVQSTNTVTSSDTVKAPDQFPENYRYFVLESQRMVNMHGTYYREGDVCSRGIILRIFPDRIILHNGSSILNTSIPDRQSPLIPPREKKGIFNDR